MATRRFGTEDSADRIQWLSSLGAPRCFATGVWRVATRGDESTRVLGGADSSQTVDVVTRGVNDRSRDGKNARRLRQWPGASRGAVCGAFWRVLKKMLKPPYAPLFRHRNKCPNPPTQHYLGVPNEISKCTQNDSDSVLGGVFNLRPFRAHRDTPQHVARETHSQRSAATVPGWAPGLKVREPLPASPTLVARACQSPRSAEKCFLLTLRKVFRSSILRSCWSII